MLNTTKLRGKRTRQLASMTWANGRLTFPTPTFGGVAFLSKLSSAFVSRTSFPRSASETTETFCGKEVTVKEVIECKEVDVKTIECIDITENEGIRTQHPCVRIRLFSVISMHSMDKIRYKKNVEKQKNGGYHKRKIKFGKDVIVNKEVMVAK